MLDRRYKKNFKKKFKNSKFNSLSQNIMGIRVLETCRITVKQLESIRRVFVRETKREGRFFIKMQINQILTKKSKGNRMGKGIGPVDSSVIDIKSGSILFEFTFFNDKIIKNFLSGIKGKLPSKSEVLYKENYIYEVY